MTCACRGHLAHGASRCSRLVGSRDRGTVMAHPPVPFSTVRRHPDLVLGDPQGEEEAALAGAFPLFSVVQPLSTANSLGQCRHLVIDVADANVIEPSGDVAAHLPPQLERTGWLCGASSPYRVGPNVRYLSIFHDRSSYRGLSPHKFTPPATGQTGSSTCRAYHKAFATDRKQPRPLKSIVRRPKKVNRRP